MNLLQESLYWLTSGLLVPCIVYLLFMLFQCLFGLGRYVANKAIQAESLKNLEHWMRDSELNLPALPSSTEHLSSNNAINSIIASDSLALNQQVVGRFEIESESYLNKFSNLAKLGPITGLVGTLIPMGPALKGLADGNIQQLAGQMQIAFSTTVIGLIVGAIGLILYQKHKSQVFKELAVLDFILDHQEREHEKSK